MKPRNLLTMVILLTMGLWGYAQPEPSVIALPAVQSVDAVDGGDGEFVLFPLPEDPRYDVPITISTSRDGTPLREFVAAIARSIGLIPIVNEVPDDLIFDYEFENTPFRQIFRIVLGLNGLDYILDDNNVVILGSIEAIVDFRAREPKPVVEEPEVVVVEVEPDAPVIPTEQRFFRVSGNAEDFATALQAAIPKADIAVIAGINSLSITATAEDLQQARAILEELDPPPAQTAVVPTVRRVYSLTNAKADELAKVLRGIKVNDEEARDTETSTTTISLNTNPNADPFSNTSVTGAAPQQEFTITPDPRTNTLIINATEKQHEQFAEIIPQLDIAQPQVNVQIRIQEINKTAAMNLGVNINAGFGNFAATLLDTGLNFVFDAGKAISGANIGAVLDTLERQGLSRRVDDTTLTVLNNGEAVMQVGGTIEINISGVPSIQRTIPYGVQINVTPQISGANGDVVNLTIAAKVSDILSSTNDPSFIQFSDRNVSSTLSLESGQTVLLGGLFQNQFKETVTGVPLLSDLPVVGSAFERTSTTESDTELLLIVTADIVNNPNLTSDLPVIGSNGVIEVAGLQ